MNHFITAYAGNKRSEYKHLKLNFQDVKNIVEPFCGSSAISFNIWKEHGDTFTYHLNDNSDELMRLYDCMRTQTAETIEEEINKLKDSVKDKETYNAIASKKEHTVYEYIYLHRYYGLRAGLYHEKRCYTNCPFKLNKEQRLFMDFIKSPCVSITKQDWTEPFNKFADDKATLLLFDPPYVSSCNMFYQNKSTNVYEFFYINPIDNFEAKIYFILEDLWIIRLLFGKFVKSSYDKSYNISKKLTSHIIISNIH